MLNEERCCSSGGVRDGRPGASEIPSAAPGDVQIIGFCAPEVAREKIILLGLSYSAALPGRCENGFPDPGLHSQAHGPPAHFYGPSRGHTSAPTWLAPQPNSLNEWQCALPYLRIPNLMTNLDTDTVG
jgi:hypothetical protein